MSHIECFKNSLSKILIDSNYFIDEFTVNITELDDMIFGADMAEILVAGDACIFRVGDGLRCLGLRMIFTQF